ncbi:MAG: hypothetical protein LBB65_05300 [Burkholderiales bacterium]|jgi:hypothetical protein|nr:hypothetical protein [Burkholderiales bacterium]
MKEVFAFHGKRTSLSARCRFGVFLPGFFLLYAGSAAAEICAYENADGQSLYTNVSPGGAWKKRECFATVETPPDKKGGTTTGARSALPKVTPEKQKERDAMRRKVIEDELNAESKLLESARAAYANGAPAALPDEFLNPKKYSARIAQLRESVDLHERNVEALKKEIAKM